MRKLINGIKNLIVWFPIIWNDWDYDHVFLLLMLRFKLKRMLPVIENGYHSNCKKDADKMRVAIRLLDRQIAGLHWYWDNAFMFHAKRHGESHHPIIDNMFTTTYPDSPNPILAEKEVSQRIDDVMAHQEQDWAFLMDWLKKYLRNWWD